MNQQTIGFLCGLLVCACSGYAQLSTTVYRIDTVAGTLPDDEGRPATQAILFSPQAIAVGSEGTIYLSDAEGVRKITPEGIITHFSHSVLTGEMVVDRHGTVHSVSGPELYSITADGESSTSRPTDGLAPIRFTDIALDSQGNLIIPDEGRRRIVRVTPNGAVSAIIGIGSGIELPIPPSEVAVDSLNNIYVSFTNRTVMRVSPDRSMRVIAGNGAFGAPVVGGPATASPFASLGSLVTNGSGELFMAELQHRQILKVTVNGMLETVATDVRATDMALDGNGNLIVLEGAKVWRLNAGGTRTLLAGKTQFDGDGGLAPHALLNTPQTVVAEPSGSLFIGDTGNHRIRKISVDGIISTVAGTGIAGSEGDGQQATTAQIPAPQLLARGPDGSFYFTSQFYGRIRRMREDGIVETIAGNGQPGDSGDGGPATSASFRSVTGLAVDHDGSVYFSDGSSNRVRRITRDGKIAAYAGTGQATGLEGALAVEFPLSSPGELAIDPEGNLLIHQRNPARLVRVDARTGYISKLIGTLPLGSPGDDLASRLCSFAVPSALAFDVDGSFLVAGNHVVCRLHHDGRSSVLAGARLSGFSGDGGPALSAKLTGPSGLSVDREGNIFVADAGNHRIRKLTPAGSAPLPGPPLILDVVPSFMGKSGFSSNAYIEIYGANLSQTTRIWASQDFNGRNAPTSLDGVSVTVNDKPAFIYYVSPTQININFPEEPDTGPARLQVRTPWGISDVLAVGRRRVSPTLHTAPQFNVGGKHYVIAQTPDFRSFIGTPNLISGIPFTLAKPGDTVLIYALGCGPTNPATQAGVTAAVNSPLALSYRLAIGGVPARVNFAGIVAGTIGLYQFNVVIPDVPPGDHPIELRIDGADDAQNLLISIGN